MDQRKGLISIEEAIYKMGGFPTAILGLTNRGTIIERSIVDVVIFDPRNGNKIP